MTTVYVTKYALSAGIQECTINEKWSTYCSSEGDIFVDWPSGLNGVASFSGDDWRSTRDEAVERANHMRLEKIASLQKQIAKLEKKVFV